jgi:aldehyde dehydrogenase (NAD+)
MKTTGIAADSYVDLHAYTLKEPYGVVGLIFSVEWPYLQRLRQDRPRACSRVQQPGETC